MSYDEKHIRFESQEFETKLLNINALLIRNEYKVWIYKHYFIPSIRFLLTVQCSYNITKSSEETKYIH